jgi:hypothetical protein
MPVAAAARAGAFGPVRRFLAPALAALALIVAGCRRGDVEGSCTDCHRGIEPASASHTGCVSCHGGDPTRAGEHDAHRGIYGLASASYAGRWELGCGPCHEHQVRRMKSSHMFTNAGMIAQIQATWEGEGAGGPFAAREGAQVTPSGTPFEHRAVRELDHLSGELYRKFCARCHLAKQNPMTDGGGHPAGCAACHFPYADGAAYRGGDRTMRGRAPHAATHAMQGLPPNAACMRCHHRSGRVALSYQGLHDGNNGLVPTRGGLPGPLPGSDERSFTHIAPDVHYAAGMECIDCHTSREVMGEGFASDRMHGQLEIGCEDCHGDGDRPPRFATVEREHELPLRESRQYGARIRPGFRMALTGKGRPYSNVFATDSGVVVMRKRTGRLLESPVVTGTPEHRIAGHQRLECYACHSRTVVQCYGCHTTYDRRETGWDFIQDRETPGVFSETEDVRTLAPFPLAVVGGDRIATVTPGCQTFVTVVEEDGRMSREEHVAAYRGKPQLRFAPFFGHNTGTRAVGCAECHGNPAFLGFGQHLIERGDVEGTLLCEKRDGKSLDGFLAMDRGAVTAHAAITRDGARPLNGDEVRRVFAVNLCLICHDRAADPIYRTRLDYRALDDSLHRRLLAAGR